MVQPNHLFDEPRYDLANFRQFTDNSITTTKYSLLTFIPYNIIHQICTKYANIYFLFIAVLNFCPLFGAYTKILGLVPISFVLGTTLIKDGFEDLRRWRYDNKINKRTCHVWDRERQMFRKMHWKHILVGDFVHVSNEQDIPADVLFLRSSDENGTCYVETCNLDGETSLKQRLVPRQYVSFSQPESNFTPSQFTGTVFCEPPDPAIYTIRAKIEYQPGHDTKVMMNNGRAPHKVSGIEQLTNKFIIVCMVILAVMVFGSSLMSGFWSRDHPPPKDGTGFVPDPFIVWNSPAPVLDGLYNVGTFIICYQVIVPISLYITVEIIKAAQIYFLSQDIELYDRDSDRPIDCRSLNIPEELGQISHILSDKTGTLTENIMVFRNCAIDRKDYGSEKNLKDVDPTQPVASTALHARVMAQWRSNANLRHFFLNMVLNNSVVVNKIPHKDALEIGFFEHGVYNIGNSSFYDITLEHFQEMVAKLTSHLPLASRPESLMENLSRIPEDDELTTVSPGLSSLPTPISPDFEKEQSVTPTLAPVSRVSSFSKFVKRNLISPLTDLIPYDSIRKRHETFIAKEEFCPYEAESPDELAIILGTPAFDLILL
ncbi:hypothetical protein NECAME_11681 [Necator americanus]|uniref:P-type ATPase N-terminal domain-containing protein n=1 Tax=Necator americanus TaxID=51031 RepID=W2T5F7_NECAM|nr:hypothetical protein NECAME_11681 [Necator americanus]ETN76421.1 hypothetical protein NECAME_11681 [Necator americanus]